jgi:1,4-dihydroxy-6-naphthoate synthase
MKLSLGFSPCPNDTFIFDALIHHKIDTEGLEFEVFYEDVETLNQKAFRAELDITKLSFHAYAKALENYVLLDAGSALGFGVGPLLIANEARSFAAVKQQPSLSIAIPGLNTTANFLLGIALPEHLQKQSMVFSEIEQALIDRQVDLGLIIHENRFTYEQKGLHKVIDLGAYWEQLTGMPIPLGGIVMKRNMPHKLQQQVSGLIRKSLAYAQANPASGLEFIRSHAQEMSEEVMYQHIQLYVNDFSLDLGLQGKLAIQTMFDYGVKSGVIPAPQQNLFIS